MTPYKLTGNRTRIPSNYEQLVISRVRPFLNGEGTANRSIEELMCEAYIQALRDYAQISRTALREEQS